jgi:hypothetical protein
MLLQAGADPNLCTARGNNAIGVLSLCEDAYTLGEETAKFVQALFAHSSARTPPDANARSSAGVPPIFGAAAVGTLAEAIESYFHSLYAHIFRKVTLPW